MTLLKAACGSHCFLIMIGTKVKGKKTGPMVFSRKIITFML